MLTSSSSGALIRRVGYEEAFRLFHEAGLDAMDFPVDDGCYTMEALRSAHVYGLSEKEIEQKYTAIRLLSEKHHVKIGQTHSAFGCFEVSDTDEFTEVIKGDIVATAALGCSVTVVHPVKIPGRIRSRLRKEGRQYNLDFFRKLIPTCLKYNVRVAIENVIALDDDGVTITSSECSDPTELAELLDTLGNSCFCACVDTGHFSLTAGATGYSVADSIRILGNRIGVIHVQETDLKSDTHTVPYTFKDTLDWDDIFRALREVGYSGIMNLEVMPHLSRYPDCPEMNFEAMRHIGAIARYCASMVCGGKR